MIVDETTRFRHREQADAPFTADSATLEITLPDSTAEASPPSVAETADSADANANIYTSAPYAVAMAGAHRVVWAISVGGQTHRRVEDYFAYWTDAPGIVRDALPDAAAMDELPDSRIDPKFAAEVRKYMPGYFTTIDRATGVRTIAAYRDLAGDDRANFDEGCAYLVAAKLLNPVTSGGAQGHLILKRDETTTEQFALQQGDQGYAAELMRNARDAFMRLSSVAGKIDEYNLIGAAGRRGRGGFYPGFYPGSDPFCATRLPWW